MMKVTTFSFICVSISVVILVMTSCGVESVPPPSEEYNPPPVESVPSPDEYNPPQDNPQPPSDDIDTSENNNSSGNNNSSEFQSPQDNNLTLPSYSEVPPEDILAQIAYGGKGAGGDEEEEPNFRIQDGEITFTGQTPHQRIRLIAYKVSPEEGCFFIGLANYVTEWYITLDENGYYRGYIEGDLKNIEIVALDADTGEEIIRDRQYGPSYVDINKVCQEMEQSCWPAPPQRMIVGERGYVCTAVDNVKLRESHSRSGNEIIRLAPGTNFDVLDGPICSDNWSWWYIETDDGVGGWISEGGDEIDPYFICPAP